MDLPTFLLIAGFTCFFVGLSIGVMQLTRLTKRRFIHVIEYMSGIKSTHHDDWMRMYKMLSDIQSPQVLDPNVSAEIIRSSEGRYYAVIRNGGTKFTSASLREHDPLDVVAIIHSIAPHIPIKYPDEITHAPDGGDS